MPADHGSPAVGLRFQLLGPVRGWRGDAELALGSAHRRAVLAVLALAGGAAVARADLIDSVWGEHSPASADGSIYTYISGLRQAIDPGRARRSGADVLASVGSGYALRVDWESIDVHRFDALRASALRHRMAGEQEAAIADFDEALALWRGEAIEGVPGPFAQTHRARLNGLRLAVAEHHAELLLELGRYDQAASELEPLCQDHLTRERLQALLMHALHGSGRTTAAIEVFASVHRNLVETSGLEPGPELRELHERLRRAANPSRQAVPAPPRPAFHVGRERELAVLRGAVAAARDGRGQVLYIDGEPGIGKSALLAQALCPPLPGAPQVRWASPTEIDSAVPMSLMADLLAVDAKSLTSDNVRKAVTELCADGPLVLVADNFQWADETSVGVWWQLAGIVEQLPVVLVSATRPVADRDPLRLLRQHARNIGRLVRVGRLSSVDALRIVRKRRGGTVVPQWLYRWIESAAGNPYYVCEILSHLPGEHDEHPPASLADRVNGYLTFLSAGARSMVQYAALLGDEFSLTELGAVVEPDPARLAELLGEARTAGILDTDGAVSRFRHPLVRACLYAKTPRAMRGALHAQFADVLAGCGAPAVHVAQQLTSAAPAGAAWTAPWLRDNIRVVAEERPQLAIRLIRQLAGQGDFTCTERVSLAATAARLLFWLGREPDAEAKAILEADPEPALAAEMRWMLGYVCYRRDQIDDALGHVMTALNDENIHYTWRQQHESLLALLADERRVPESRLARWWSDIHGDAVLPALLDTEALRAAEAPGPQLGQLAPCCALPAELHLINATLYYWAGNWTGVTAELNALTEDEQQRPSYVLRAGATTSASIAIVHGIRAMLAAHRADCDTAAHHLRLAAEPQVDHDRSLSFMRSAQAMLAEIDGQPRKAIELLSPIAVEHGRFSRWLPTFTRLVVWRGDREQVERLRRHTRPGPLLEAEQELLRAHSWALLAGKPDQLVAIARDYSAIGGLDLLRAHAVADAAWLLVRQGRRDEGVVACQEAVHAYRAFGAEWDVRRVEVTMRARGGDQLPLSVCHCE